MEEESNLGVVSGKLILELAQIVGKITNIFVADCTIRLLAGNILPS